MDLARTDTNDAATVVAATDDAVAHRVRDDRGAFAELYVRHRDAVFGYLRARTFSDDDALELTAVTFERALAAIDRYSPRGAGFRAWLFRIARNAATDEARRRRRGGAPQPEWEAHGFVDQRPGPEAATVLHDDLRRLRAGLQALGDDQRDALGLRFGARLTAREIGAVLDKREAAVQKLIERAIARLREVLA